MGRVLCVHMPKGCTYALVKYGGTKESCMVWWLPPGSSGVGEAHASFMVVCIPLKVLYGAIDGAIDAPVWVVSGIVNLPRRKCMVV